MLELDGVRHILLRSARDASHGVGCPQGIELAQWSDCAARRAGVCRATKRTAACREGTVARDTPLRRLWMSAAGSGERGAAAAGCGLDW